MRAFPCHGFCKGDGRVGWRALILRQLAAASLDQDVLPSTWPPSRSRGRETWSRERHQSRPASCSRQACIVKAHSAYPVDTTASRMGERRREILPSTSMALDLLTRTHQRFDLTWGRSGGFSTTSGWPVDRPCCGVGAACLNENYFEKKGPIWPPHLADFEHSHTVRPRSLAPPRKGRLGAASLVVPNHR